MIHSNRLMLPSFAALCAALGSHIKSCVKLRIDNRGLYRRFRLLDEYGSIRVPIARPGT